MARVVDPCHGSRRAVGLTLLGEFAAAAANEPGRLVESRVYVASLPLGEGGARIEPAAAGP